MRFVASLAANGRKSHIGDRSDRITPVGIRSRPGNEAIDRVTGQAIGTGGASRESVAGYIPLGALNMVSRGIVALVTVAGLGALANEIGVAQRVGMLAARPVTVFALDIGEGGQRGHRCLHVRPVRSEERRVGQEC